MTTNPCVGRHEFRATGTSKLAWNVQAREDSSKDSLSRLPTLSLAGFATIWSSGGGGHLFSPQVPSVEVATSQRAIIVKQLIQNLKIVS